MPHIKISEQWSISYSVFKLPTGDQEKMAGYQHKQAAEMNIPELQTQQCQPIYIYLGCLQWKIEGSQVDQLDQLEDPVKARINILWALERDTNVN